MTQLLSSRGVHISQRNFQQVIIRGDGNNQFNEIINKEISIFPPSKNDKSLNLASIFKASKTFDVAVGIMGFSKIEIFAICSSDKCKILFIFSISFV